MKITNNNIKGMIHNFIDGESSEKETDALWAHLLGSTDDLEYMQTLATLKKMGNSGRFSDVSYTAEKSVSNIFAIGEESHIYAYAKHYLAAAAILVMGLAVLFNVIPGGETATEYNPIAMIEYDIERSAEDLTLFDQSLQRAVSQSSAGNVTAALATLESIAGLVADEPAKQTELHLVKGSILYNSGKFSDAADIFRQINNQNPDRLSLEKSTWYLANAQIHLGELDAARENISKVIEMDGSFSRVAAKALEVL